MKDKVFDKAIQNFEKAFNICADKDVFVFLAHIYKRLKTTKALNSLITKWQKAQE